METVIDPRLGTSKPSETTLALWVGGPAGKEFNKICKNLEAYGIKIIDRWDSDEACRHKHVPSRANLVLANRDLVRHKAYDHIKRITEQDGKPFIPANLSLMQTLKQLRQQKIPIRLTADAKLDEKELMSFQTQGSPPPTQERPSIQPPQPPKPTANDNDKIYEAKVLEIAKRFAADDGDPTRLLLFVRPEMERGSIRLLSILEKCVPDEPYRIEPKQLAKMAVRGTLNVSTYASDVGVSYATAQKIFFRAATLGYVERAEPYTDGLVRGEEPTFSMNVKATEALFQKTPVKSNEQVQIIGDIKILVDEEGHVSLLRDGGRKTRPVIVGESLFESSVEASKFLEIGDSAGVAKRLHRSTGPVEINGFEVYHPTYEQVMAMLPNLVKNEPVAPPSISQDSNSQYVSPYTHDNITLFEEDGKTFAFLPTLKRQKSQVIMLDEELYLSVSCASVALGLSLSALGHALHNGHLKRGPANYHGRVVRWPSFQMACHLLRTGKAHHHEGHISSAPVPPAASPTKVDAVEVFHRTHAVPQTPPQQPPAQIHPDLTYLDPKDQGEVMTALKLLLSVLKDCKSAKYHSVRLIVETGEVEVDVTSTRKHTFKL